MSRPYGMSEYFGLSRANYLTIPRSIIEDMPEAWQRNLAALLAELDERYVWPLNGESVEVRLRDASGRYIEDPLADYRHPDEAAMRRSGWHELLEKTFPKHDSMEQKEQRKDAPDTPST